MSCSNSGVDAARLEREALLFDDVQADDAEIADVLLHQVGNVVIAHEQHVERHVLAVAHQLIFAAAVLEAAADQQVERVVGQAPGFLQCDFEARGFVHDGSAGGPRSAAVLSGVSAASV